MRTTTTVVIQWVPVRLILLIDNEARIVRTVYNVAFDPIRSRCDRRRAADESVGCRRGAQASARARPRARPRPAGTPALVTVPRVPPPARLTRNGNAKRRAAGPDRYLAGLPESAESLRDRVRPESLRVPACPVPAVPVRSTRRLQTRNTQRRVLSSHGYSLQSSKPSHEVDGSGR